MSGKSRQLMVTAFCVILVCGGSALAVTLSGRVYEGSVGDESKPLSGVTVTLYASNDENQQGTAVISSTTTNSSGWYELSVRGAYDYFNIVQTNLSGYSSEGATTVSGSVKSSDWIQYDFLALSGTTTGNKFWDKKEGGEPPRDIGVLDGYKRDADTGTGLENWRIYIDLDSNGQWDAGEPSDLTDGNGYYRIANVEPGTYRVCEQMQTGWEGDQPCVEGVTVLGGVITTQDFHNRRTPPPDGAGTIRGAKFNDLNGNGQRDPGEPGVPGWQIVLQDTDGNVLATATTDTNGDYAFTGLEPGAYDVDEVPQSGWRQTYPEIDGGPAVWVIGLEPGGVIDEVDFGNVRSAGTSPCAYFAMGTKYNDLNGDGQRDLGSEPGLAGWRIYQDLNENGRWDEGEPNDITDANGDYRLCIDEGDSAYEPPIREVLEDGWVQTEPGPPLYAHHNAEACFLIWPEGCYGLDFGNRRTDEPPPNIQVDVLDLCLNVEIDIPGIGLVHTSLTGPTTIHTQIGPNGETSDVFQDGRDIADTEMVDLNLQGIDPVVGTVRMTLTANRPSKGFLVENINSTPGILDVPPFTATGTAHSVFNIFFDIELPDLGLHYCDCKPMIPQGAVSHWPPAGWSVYSVVNLPIELYRSNGSTYPCLIKPLPPADAVVLSVWDCRQPPPGGDGRGSIVVIKEAIPADDTLFLFCANFRPGGFFDTLCAYLQDPSNNTWTINNPSLLQQLIETVPAGWTLTDITITGDTDSGSAIDVANASVDIDFDAGENIVITFKNEKRGSGEYDFGDAPVSYGNAWHTLNENLTMGPTIDAEAVPNYSSDATGDDTHHNDDEDGVAFSTGLAWGKQVEVCVEVYNNDSNPSDVTVAGWIDFDGNGQWEPIANHIGTRSVHLPPSSIVKECWMFTVPQNAKPGDTFARFRLYRDDPNPLAIPFAVLPTGEGGEGEVEDYRVYILSDAPGPDDELDYGDAPSSYGSSSHDVGRLRIGDLIDGEIAPKYSANADGDDLDNMPDEDGVSLKSDLLPGQNAGLQIKLTTAPGWPDAHSTAWVAVWIDFNQDGQFQDLTEVITPYAFASVLTPQYELRLYSFTVPATAKTGTTFMRVRATAHPGPLNLQWSSTGHGGDGEVEDYQVTIKSDGQALPPGQIFGGLKFNDLNGNGQQDSGEPGLASWTIWIDLNGNGAKDPGEDTLTNPDGSFYLAALSPGTYIVHEELQSGWTQTYPGGAGTHTITIQAGQAVPSIMFGNRRSGGPTTGGRICGRKWSDLNGDGTPDATEPSLANWKIYLDLNQNSRWDAGEPFQLTDAAGSFEFTGLAVGSYTVAEEMQPGWSQTWPGGGGTHVIQVQSGMQPACVMFGNRQGGPGPGPDQTFDWGDAPDPTHPTLRSSNGAYHVIVPGFHLGASIDGEPDGLPSPDALGDDNFGTDDEDGVAFLTPILPGGMAGLQIVTSAAGLVDAWIDFDGDGSWSQPGDQILAFEPVAAGSNVLSVAIPASAQFNITTFARFRLSRTGGLPPEGPAQDGEVEDYHILLGEDGPGVPGEGRRPHLKWSQPPIEIDPNVDAPPVFCGWGEVSTSTQDLGGRRSWSMKVDDFHCLGPIPITRIRWWGSYKAWEWPELPEVLPDHWRISFWANDPDDLQEDPFLPERVVHTLEVARERVSIEAVGLSEFPDARSEMCFAYEVTLEPHEFFHQAELPADEQVFWISITAVYLEGASRQNQWRWMTRPSVWGRGAEGFVLYDEGPDAQPSLFPGLFSPVFRASPCDRDEGYELCFELLTDEPWVKWDQPFTGIRDWPGYVDVQSQGISIRQDESIGRAVADDWLCEQDTPVIAAAWWGSYIGYGYEPCACQQVREPPRPDYFLLQMRTGHSEMPGEVIWEYRAYDYDEVLVGYDRHPEGEPNEPVFRYSVRFPADSWFRQRGADGTYWFSVTAVYTDPLPMILHPWGWTSHRHVFGSPALATDGDPQAALQWHEPDSAAWPVDMSFTLFTAPQPGPIAHWRFDESEGDIAFDSAGENHGTVYGGTWTEGVIDGAIQLNGLNDYVDCGESDALDPERMTLTIWLRPEHMGGMRWLLSRARTEADVDYGVKRHLEGQIEFVVVPEQGDWVSLMSNETVPLGEWSHVAAICDAEQLSLCINGQPDGTTPCPPRPPRTGYRFVIGSLLGQTRFYHGKIDDVQLYDVPLPPENIAEIAGN